MSIYFYLAYISPERDNSHWATVTLSESHAIVVKMIITYNLRWGNMSIVGNMSTGCKILNNNGN